MFDIVFAFKKFFYNFYSKSKYLWAHFRSLVHHWTMFSCARTRESKRVVSKNQRKQILNNKSLFLFYGQTVYRQETGKFSLWKKGRKINTFNLPMKENFINPLCKRDFNLKQFVIFHYFRKCRSNALLFRRKRKSGSIV